MKNRKSASHVRTAFVASGRSISRRSFLRGAGIAVSLPLLEAMLPAFASNVEDCCSPISSGAKPRRMLAICNNLGLLPEEFFPKTGGRQYTPTRMSMAGIRPTIVF